MTVMQLDEFKDPGASCIDDSDANTVIKVFGGEFVNTRYPTNGFPYTIEYDCFDSSGNPAPAGPLTREVYVENPCGDLKLCVKDGSCALPDKTGNNPEGICESDIYTVEETDVQTFIEEACVDEAAPVIELNRGQPGNPGYGITPIDGSGDVIDNVMVHNLVVGDRFQLPGVVLADDCDSAVQLRARLSVFGASLVSAKHPTTEPILVFYDLVDLAGFEAQTMTRMINVTPPPPLPPLFL